MSIKKVKKPVVKKVNAYLITLSGGGDIEYKLVDKETWDFIWSDKDDIPDIVKKDIFREFKSDKTFAKWEDVDQDHFCGDSWNDRALCICPYLLGKRSTFYDIKSLQKFIDNNNIEIISEDKGSIY